jgi:hypothetical protein
MREETAELIEIARMTLGKSDSAIIKLPSITEEDFTPKTDMFNATGPVNDLYLLHLKLDFAYSSAK